MEPSEIKTPPKNFWTRHLLGVYAMPRFGAALVANLQGFVITFWYS
ncbi:MAG TPA: hypothetical protein VKM55_15560 [Candidatus Lokiarchaeia archaeon]|nr:hypothetical protein [Candidatus Lokiarchaeia archaeon]